ncbi:MAG TPA: hypothetical protein VJ785_12480 [Anaerolineales bacterium]|nr:hypothetical protein [Anaerolineales bacterium]
MFENLRDSSYYDDEQNDLTPEPQVKPASAPKQKRKKSRSAGMSGLQRFLLAFMFMIMVCVLGLLMMFISGSMSLF